MLQPGVINMVSLDRGKLMILITSTNINYASNYNNNN